MALGSILLSIGRFHGGRQPAYICRVVCSKLASALHKSASRLAVLSKGFCGPDGGALRDRSDKRRLTPDRPLPYPATAVAQSRALSWPEAAGWGTGGRTTY